MIETTCNKDDNYDRLNQISDSMINMGTALHEFARLCYQLNVFVNVPDNIKLLGLQETNASLSDNQLNISRLVNPSVSTLGMYATSNNREELNEPTKEVPTITTCYKYQ